VSGFPYFADQLDGPLRTGRLTCLQVNLGKLCNQACKHCHVDAGPKRTEIMTSETVDSVIEAIDALAPESLDLTGGAPEMNPHFRRLVTRARALGVAQIIDRCNLTILSEPGYAWAAEFLAENEVVVTASLPHFAADHVDRQRGVGVFDRSIEGLRMLNALGYGRDLPLNLVYNPQGAYLPGDQAELEEHFKSQLLTHHGVSFNHLFTITNMPIARFESYLKRSGNYDKYMGTLVSRFNPATISSLMCRNLISVGWDGLLYDCDFNQMLDLTLEAERPHIAEITELVLEGREIKTGVHCYGCTAGSGSSCGGALEAEEAAIPV